MKKPLGIILYKGKSLIDGQPIIVIATGIRDKSKNKKTGNVIQTWILRRDIPPIIAKQLGHDYSVCGDCKHRHFGSCYVYIAHGPHNVFQAFHNDRYVEFKDEHIHYFEGKTLRLGAYGDPAAVPVKIWDKICSASNSFLGYTHQWNTRFIEPELKDFCMASCDNENEYNKAKSLGWRCFRVRFDDTQPLLDNEFICPASNEAGNKTSCEKCKACMGHGAKTKKDPCIIVHGLEHKIVNFKKGMKKIAWKEGYKKEFQYPLKKKKVAKKKSARMVKI